MTWLVLSTAFLAGYFHAGGFGQFFDGLGEVQVVVVHDETEGIAASAAAEAIVELLVGADAERRRFFLYGTGSKLCSSCPLSSFAGES
nr:hypothetical protein GCM10020185_41230 [Pseudomonas brassicacearum subsp. brassicacearum]